MGPIPIATMPSVSSLDITLPPKLDAVHVGVFQPPQTPSASDSLSSLSPDHTTRSCRKRSRYARDTLELAIPHYAQRPKVPSPPTMEYSDQPSPAPFVNTQYRLAGGLDTPSTALAVHSDMVFDEDLPKIYSRGGKEFEEFESDYPQPGSTLHREQNGRSRVPTSSGNRGGMDNAVHRVLGIAVLGVGKVFEFCRKNAFQGFFAGGGQGYDVAYSTQNDKSVRIKYNAEKQNEVPGRFPEEDFIPDYMSQDHTTTPPRPAKKKKRENEGGEICASWVLVGKTPSSRESSPSRLSHRKVPLANICTRRSVPKNGRRPMLSQSSLNSYAGSPGQKLDRPAALLSPRSTTSSPKHESPVSLDVQRHAARIRKRDLEDDANLKRFNQQLKAMIKEGREALGTTFEVEDEDDDIVTEQYKELRQLDEGDFG